ALALRWPPTAATTTSHVHAHPALALLAFPAETAISIEPTATLAVVIVLLVRLALRSVLRRAPRGTRLATARWCARLAMRRGTRVIGLGWRCGRGRRRRRGSGRAGRREA